MANSYVVKIHPARKDEGGYWGYFPDIPGAITQAGTLKEFKENAKEALSLCILTLKGKGMPVPEPKYIPRGFKTVREVRITPELSDKL